MIYQIIYIETYLARLIRIVILIRLAEMINDFFETRNKIYQRDSQNLKQIIDRLCLLPEAIWFLEPVDHVKLNIPDYPIIIKRPMDLGSIRHKIQYNNYHYIESCLDDIELVWDNCKIFNAKQHDIYLYCLKLEQVYQKMLKNYFPFIKKSHGNQTNHDKKEDLGERQSDTTSKKSSKKTSKKKNKGTKAIEHDKIEQEKKEDDVQNLRNTFIEMIPKGTPRQVAIILQIIKDFSINTITVDEKGAQKVNLEAISQSLMRRLIDQLQIWDIRTQER